MHNIYKEKGTVYSFELICWEKFLKDILKDTVSHT